MPSTHLSRHYHLVFSTKDRRPLIVPARRERFHAYLGGVVRTAGGVPVAVGGTSDHVHLLVGLRATHRLADVLRELKSTSSAWMRLAGPFGTSNRLHPHLVPTFNLQLPGRVRNIRRDSPTVCCLHRVQPWERESHEPPEISRT